MGSPCAGRTGYLGFPLPDSELLLITNQRSREEVHYKHSLSIFAGSPWLVFRPSGFTRAPPGAPGIQVCLREG